MTLRVALLDTTALISAPDDVAAQLAGLLPRSPAGGPTTARLEVLPTGASLEVHGDGEVHPAADAAEAVELVLTLLNRIVLGQCADLAVHAGVVARGGRAVAFPAESGAGKSTLVAACLAAGFDYVSDEALVLTPDRTVRAYAKPLSLLGWTLDRLGLPAPPPGRQERPLTAAQLGAAAVTGRVVLAELVVLHRRPGAAVLAPLDRAPAAVHLLGHAFNHYRDPAASLALASGVVRAACAWRLSYDDPVHAAELLLARLSP